MALILKPADWERISHSSFRVILAGLPEGSVLCRLWRAEDFFAGRLQGTPLLEAPVGPRIGDLGLVWFHGVEAWGACVLMVVDITGTRLAVSGVHLGLGPNNDAVRDSRPDLEDMPAEIVYPLGTRVRRTADLRLDEVHDPGLPATLSDLLRAEAPSGGPIHVATLGKPETHNVTKVLGPPIGQPSSSYIEQAPHSYDAEPPHVAHLTNAFVNMRRGLICSASMLWGPSSRQALHGDTNLVLFPEFARHDGRLVLATGGGVRRYRSRKIPALLCNAGAGNFGHWVMNSLMAAYILRQELETGKIEFVSPALSPFMRESLRVLDLLQHVREVEDTHLLFDRVLFPSPLSTHSNACPPTLAVSLFSFIKERVRDHVGSHRLTIPNSGRYLYLTRRGFPSGRVLTNEEELIQALRDIGFACVAPHELDFAEEVETFRNAEIIVSPLGASLVNQGFAPSGCDIVEITTNAYHSNEFVYLSGLLGHRVARVLVEVPADAVQAVGCFAYSVPVRDVVNRVREIQSFRQHTISGVQPGTILSASR